MMICEPLLAGSLVWSVKLRVQVYVCVTPTRPYTLLVELAQGSDCETSLLLAPDPEPKLLKINSGNKNRFHVQLFVPEQLGILQMSELDHEA
jgi:hypothetical protein